MGIVDKCSLPIGWRSRTGPAGCAVGWSPRGAWLGLLLSAFCISPVGHNAWAGEFVETTSLPLPRGTHIATLLPTGKVLVAGGSRGSLTLATAELFDPANETWTPAATMPQARTQSAATLLSTNRVLVIGGYNGGRLASTVLYDIASDSWSSAASLNVARTTLSPFALLPARCSWSVVMVRGDHWLQLNSMTRRATHGA